MARFCACAVSRPDRSTMKSFPTSRHEMTQPKAYCWPCAQSARAWARALQTREGMKTTKKEVNAKCGNSECQVRMSVELPAYCPICSMNSMVPMVEVREV